ncbi:type II toxin-antitoxin system HicA family toxin [Kribbella soli]|uniref:Type II toxin-antitoxin system HicA family toxin n=1 Tax=Kribbella soli TaxID=1124743 RepID=A0A4R0GZS4_9ACTN|nr:type II toxin-antitoxin system HicA family toxin [Kribbella soli]TCC02718.1 type II toxin-antitoxin system HicA family toxin [Kribbella soli]
MPKKFRDADKDLKDAGYTPSRQNGSHITYKNSSGKTVTVPKHKEIKTGTWSSIMKQAGLKKSKPRAVPDADQVKRLANDGVARPGSAQVGGSGTQNQPAATPNQQAGKSAARGASGLDGR